MHMLKDKLTTVRKFFKYLFRGVLLSIIFVLLIVFYTMFQIERTARMSSENKADAAIVLGAAAWGKRPSPVFRERIRHAVDLYKQGRVGVLIFTGGSPREGVYTEAEVGKEYAIKAGVPEQSIIMENESRNTYENFANTKIQIQGLPYETFLVVSDPYHMHRALIIARDQDLTVYPSPTPTTRFNDSKSQMRFLVNETGSVLYYQIQRFFI